MSQDKLIKVLKKHDIKKDVLTAISAVDRSRYFDSTFCDRIDDISPIPIGHGEHSDDVIIMARMIDIFSPKKNWRVLEVGSGSGYSTSVLAQLVTKLVAIEYYEDLALSAKERVYLDGYSHVKFYSGDATDSEEPEGLFDGIIVFAACRQTPYALVNKLKPGGVVLFPMGPVHQQQLALYRNAPEESALKSFRFHDFCLFDSIQGLYGWKDPNVLAAQVLNQEAPEKSEEKK